ncbi:DUF1641 domain-containing protein [Oceanobacillus senegalensis]|uniref:DUF1641 domain-containing protein n=1 Tax=Oceanobacillus senegalensis TaxID=1936063 RepID=UPI000A30840E|nr:DUF1641 domain-containing protein [Oceanobacillus senegalensis]
MARAIRQIEKNQRSAEEERAEDIAAIIKQIAENREAIEDTLIILEELHQFGVLDMLKGLLRTREKVGAIAIEQLNQSGMHNIIKNGMSTVQLLADMDPEQIKTVFNGVNHGLKNVAETTNYNEDIGMWNLYKSAKDIKVRNSLNAMVQFLNGMSEGLSKKHTS